MEIGDLVIIKHSDYSPFYIRPEVGVVGIILKVRNSTSMGLIYYIQTVEGIWKFSDYELELLSGNR